MSTSKRSAILNAVRARLETISVLTAYATNAGAQVFVGVEPELGPDDPRTAIVLFLGPVAPNQSRAIGYSTYRIPIVIQALASVLIDDPMVAAEELLGDIMQAIEQADRTLGGILKGPLEDGEIQQVEGREAGTTTVGVGITYYAPHVRKWGTV